MQFSGVALILVSPQLPIQLLEQYTCDCEVPPYHHFEANWEMQNSFKEEIRHSDRILWLYSGRATLPVLEHCQKINPGCS